MRWSRRLRGAAPAIVSAIASMVVWLATSAVTLAASPSPTAAAGGDPRSAGQGPVVLIGLVSLLATLAWVRATGGPRGS
jgi:hypothetical protein